MKKTLKFLGLLMIYSITAAGIVCAFVYFYRTNDFFRALFEGTVTAHAKPGPGGTASLREAAQSVENINKMAARLSFFILVFILVFQSIAFITAATVFLGLRRSKEVIQIRMKKLENADLFLDLPLYFGLLGTVSSFIVMSFNPNISRLIAYSSTLVGIIFSVVLRLLLQYPLKQKLISETVISGKELEQ